MLSAVSDDVLTEQAIRKWFDEAHVAKGKSVFLTQMKPMIDWLRKRKMNNLSQNHY